MSRNEPRGFLEETRTALVEAAFELIERDGFAETTAAAIAGKAGFTERTFFRYFPVKEDVVFSPIASQFDDYLHQVRVHVSAEGLSVDSLIAAILEANEHPPSRGAVVLRGMFLAKNNPELERRLAFHLRWATDRIAETVAEVLGQDRPELSVRVTVAVAVAIMATATDHWMAGARQAPIREFVADARRAAGEGLSGLDVPRRP